ncbi:hypothetical protein [Streptomyces parvus]|uniref:hypothetical protein n=1 Tax=Streptomyces parvus TaxID=66428 RepID=UPI00331D94D4
MTGQPRIALDDLTSDALDALYDERDAARDRLDYHEQSLLPDLRRRAESDRQAIGRWRARAETAEARVTELEAENARYEEVVVGDLNEANTGLQRQAARVEARVRELEAERTNLLSVLTEAVDWIRDGDLRDRMLDAITPPRPAALCGCGRPDPGPCNPCPDNTPSLHCACDCTPAQAEHGEGAAGM